MATKKTPASTKTATPAKAPGKPRNQKNLIPIGDKNVPVYASPRVAKAMEEITEDMTLYHGVRLSQVLEAVYTQGQKDGARNAIETLENKVAEIKNTVPHRNPGQPKKPQKNSKGK
ncbi:hypothetical protein [Burkholderia ubonensis]|uniref:hypothetical protein n=1 Tax=Burkholderia ubonensis TaxID=101571 RepID=UPI0010541A70|nr:hypothetical protein [Burkholderia ubonensis]